MAPAKPQSVPVGTLDTAADTVVEKPSATRTVVAPAKKQAAQTAAKAAAAAGFKMTYMGKPFLVEGQAYHRLVERYRGGWHVTLSDVWVPLLFFGFLATAFAIATLLELSL